MTRKIGQDGGQKRSELNTDTSDQEYRVGPGHPPKEYQFKPGRSGNPKGASRKTPSIALDLKALLERALSKTVKLTQGEKERIITKAEVGMEQLVNQFAKGDRHARRESSLWLACLASIWRRARVKRSRPLSRRMTKPCWPITCNAMGSSAIRAVTIMKPVFLNQKTKKGPATPAPAIKQHHYAGDRSPS
jgi:hypothetical protein